MSDQSEDNASNKLIMKLAYPVLGVVALLVAANLLSSSSNSRPEQRRDDFLGRVERITEPWMVGAEKASNTAANIFEGIASSTERLTESFNRQPNGE